jgi:hypothetical protein
MANICYRSYISWQDCDEAERDGNVLVLTSPAKTFVDVRLKPGAQGIQGMLCHLSRLDYLVLVKIKQRYIPCQQYNFSWKITCSN